jgi:lipopolysaccharide transport protein LptA
MNKILISFVTVLFLPIISANNSLLNEVEWLINNHFSGTEITLSAKTLKQHTSGILSFNSPSLQIKGDGDSKKVESVFCDYNPLNKIFEFKNSASVKITSSVSELKILSEEIIFDEKKNLLYSNLKSELDFKNTSLTGDNFVVKKDKIKGEMVILTNGIIEMRSDLRSEHFYGEAKKIKYFINSDLVVMTGSALIKDKDITIEAEEIYLDVNLNKIIKSINSKIINSPS